MPYMKTVNQELTLILKFLGQKIQVFQKEIFRMQTFHGHEMDRSGSLKLL